MAITKPYTFQAGTKARASEVNQDFDILYSEVNRIGTEILNIEIDIQNVADGKADINGNAGQVFKMADAVDSYDGVNKNFLENAIANIKDYIRGFAISKNTDTSIIVSSGSCYDSTYTVVINSTGNITKENTIQGAGTRYVHAISDNTGNQTDILISSQSISPALPSGYTRYRLIGNYTADSNGKINTIISYGHDSTAPQSIATIIEAYQNGTSGYIVFSNKLSMQWGRSVHGSGGRSTVTFLKPFANENAMVTCSGLDSGFNNTDFGHVTAISATQASFASANGSEVTWFAIGYIA